jgi:hypothetical protein
MSYLQVLSCVLVRLKNKKQEQLSALENQIWESVIMNDDTTCSDNQPPVL